MTNYQAVFLFAFMSFSFLGVFLLGLKAQDIFASFLFLSLLVFALFHITVSVMNAFKVRPRELLTRWRDMTKSAERGIERVSTHSFFQSTVKTLLLLEALSAIIFHKWLSFSIFISGDYHWIPANNLAYLKPLSAWRAFVTTGEPNWVLWSGYLTRLFGVFGDMGWDSNVVMNVLVLWFLALIAPIISFFFVRRFTKNVFTAFIFCLLLLFNSYVLTNIVVGHLLLNVAFYLSLAAITMYSIFLESNFKKTYALVLATLLLWVTGIVDFRIFYLVAICFAVYQVLHLLLTRFQVSPWTFIWKNALFLMLLILLNFNWILPTMVLQGSNDILARPIFGKGLIELFHSWSGTYYYWSIANKVVWGKNTGFPGIFMLLPLLVMVVLFYSKKSTNLLIFAVLFLLGAFFGKQNTAPFARVYEFMFAYFPGFSAFRDSSKFFQVTTFSIPVILALGYETITRKGIRNAVLLGALLITTLNVYSLVRYQDHLFTPTQVPDYYQDLFALESDRFERVMWAPRHEAIRAGSTTNPRLTLVEMKDTTWSKILAKKGMPQGANDILRSVHLPGLLAMSSVKYIFVPEQLQTYDMLINDDAYYYDDNREQIIKILDSYAWLQKRPIQSTRATIYEVKLTRPHFYLTSERETLGNFFGLEAIEVENTFINPSIYTVYLKNVRSESYLTFTDTYSQQWLLGKPYRSAWSFANTPNIVMPEERKLENKAGGNVFKIDPEYLKSVTDQYEVNSDGSVNATLSVYYSPQKQLIWGNYVTVGTLILTTGYFAWIYLKKRVRKHE